MSLPGGDSATPKPPEYAGNKVWGVYVAGATFHIWTHAEVAELSRHGVEGVMPIIVPPQDRAWWLEGESGYPVLESLVREANAWGVPKGAPLCLDIEEHQFEQMPNPGAVCHAWAIASRGHGYRTWTYGSRTFLLNDHYGFRWVAEWDNDPTIPQGFNAHQYADRPGDGIDLDTFEAGRDYMTPDRRVILLEVPSVKSHSEPAASSVAAADSTEGGLTVPAPVTEAGVSDITPANSSEHL
jgi:hypothetical protein